MDSRRPNKLKFTKDDETHAAINNKMFKRLGYINNQLYEVELSNPEIEHAEPIIVGFFSLQYDTLKMLACYNNFLLTKYVILTSLRRWKWIPTHCI